MLMKVTENLLAEVRQQVTPCNAVQDIQNIAVPPHKHENENASVEAGVPVRWLR